MSSSTAPPAAAARDDASITDWYRVSFEDAAARLGAAPVSGLTESEARKRLDQYGPNVCVNAPLPLQSPSAQIPGTLVRSSSSTTT